MIYCTPIERNQTQSFIALHFWCKIVLRKKSKIEKKRKNGQLVDIQPLGNMSWESAKWMKICYKTFSRTINHILKHANLLQKLNSSCELIAIFLLQIYSSNLLLIVLKTLRRHQLILLQIQISKSTAISQISPYCYLCLHSITHQISKVCARVILFYFLSYTV